MLCHRHTSRPKQRSWAACPGSTRLARPWPTTSAAPQSPACRSGPLCLNDDAQGTQATDLLMSAKLWPNDISCETSRAVAHNHLTISAHTQGMPDGRRRPWRSWARPGRPPAALEWAPRCRRCSLNRLLSGAIGACSGTACMCIWDVTSSNVDRSAWQTARRTCCLLWCCMYSAAYDMLSPSLSTLPQRIADTAAAAAQALKSAQRDNDTVYLQRVPPAASVSRWALDPANVCLSGHYVCILLTQ